MPITLERTVFVTDNSLRVNIPEPVAKALELEAGDKALISLNDHQMTLEKAKKAKG